MGRLPLLLAAAIVAGVTTILVSGTYLPPDVAMHFGPFDAPNGWAARNVYLAIMVAQVVLDPIALLGAALLARRAPGLANLPNAEHWLAAPRRAATVQRLARFLCMLGILLVAFLTALHLVIVVANTTSPPALPLVPFFVVLGAFLAATGIWALRLTAGFRVKP